MNKDIHIYYGGGSGGHVCAHLILQSHQHFSVFDPTNIPANPDEFYHQFKMVKQNQWSIDQPTMWKNKECYYDNATTASVVLPGMGRLFLTVNPSANLIPDPNVINVMIYSDIDTQMEIAVVKRCSVFYKITRLEEECYNLCNIAWKKGYACVSEPHWPVVDLCDIDQLPEFIINELKTVHQNFDMYLRWPQHRLSYKTYQELIIAYCANSYLHGNRVFDDVAKVAAKMDHAVKLQHIVQTRGRCLLDAVELPWTAEHGALMDHWLLLHSDALQQKLLSKID